MHRYGSLSTTFSSPPDTPPAQSEFSRTYQSHDEESEFPMESRYPTTQDSVRSFTRRQGRYRRIGDLTDRYRPQLRRAYKSLHRWNRKFLMFLFRCYFIIFLVWVACCGIISFFLWVELRVSTQDTRRPYKPPNGFPPMTIIALLKSIDLDEKTIRVNWIIDSFGWDMDIYFDSNAHLLITESPNVQPDIQYRVNATSFTYTHPHLYEPSFGPTDLPIRNRDFNFDHWPQPQSYPLDRYSVRVFAIAKNPYTDEIIPITSLQFSGVLTSWSYTHTWGISGRQDYPGTGRLEEAGAKGLWITEVDFKRSRSTLVFCFMIVAINWGITISVMWVTWGMMAGRRRVPKEHYAVPLTALFALPPLRGAMPGVPEVGCMIDYVGTIPNVCLIAICAILIIWMSIRFDTTELFPFQRYDFDVEALTRLSSVGDRGPKNT